MLAFIVGAVLGFVAGALVFRNNKSKGEAVVAKVESTVADVKAKVG